MSSLGIAIAYGLYTICVLLVGVFLGRKMIGKDGEPTPILPPKKQDHGAVSYNDPYLEAVIGAKAYEERVKTIEGDL